ncbi:MAG: hypothetical protein ABIQ88_22910 [Chitinophagaceae bacterium]
MFRHVCLFLLVFLTTVTSSSWAQKKSVLIEPQKRKINQDALLPAQTYFNLQVPVSSQTGIIQVDIYRGKSNSDLLEHSYWVRPVNFTGDFAELPVDLKLKSNSNYSFGVTIYSILSDSEKTQLHFIAQQHISNYLDATIQTDDARIDLSRKPEQMIADLNSIVNKSTVAYKNMANKSFDGFSDIVKLKIQQVVNARLKNAAYNVERQTGDSTVLSQQLKLSYSDQLQNELKKIIVSELDNYLALDFVRVYDQFIVKNQFTERSQAVLPLFIGYGAVYLSGNVRDLNYDAQPYAGFSIPLGRGDGKYFSRTTFIMGIFLRNFKDGNDSTLTGPIVDRPIFAGLGFRLYDFINFNAGLVATSASKQNLSNIKTENIQLHPFIGLNFQFNLWAGINKK